MRCIHGAVSTLLFAAIGALATPAAGPGAFAAPFAPLSPAVPVAKPGTVLVALRPDAAIDVAPGGTLRARDGALGPTLARFSLTGAARLDAAGERRPGARARFFALRSDAPDFDPYAAAEALRAEPGVLAASPDVALRLHRTPNDPWYANQWHLGPSAAAVRAPQAWDRSTGSSSVVVAILDSGVDLTHADLAYKIWRNEAEVPLNGLDDDGNGYADDVNGWDFGDLDADPDPEPIADEATGIDIGWHGTFVAGLAAASTNNGTGVAGVAWNCRVMPLKVLDVEGTIWLDAIVAGFDYAIAHGAGVLNLSMGATDPAAAEFFQALVDEALAGDVVVVASAGNAGTDTPTYPAACEGVLAVAATNAANNRASFSNWGPWVDLAAPGEGVWSCISRNYAYDAWSLYAFQQYWGFDGAHAYLWNDGTSFAAPIVAGAAALVRSLHPQLTAAQVAQQLVVDGDARAYDNPIGPRLNVDRALALPLDAGREGPQAATAFLAAPWPNPATRSVGFGFALPARGPVRLAIHDAAGRRVATPLAGELAAGAGHAEWNLRDDAGTAVSAGLFFARLEAGGRTYVRRFAVVR